MGIPENATTEKLPTYLRPETCKQFFQNGTETLQYATVDCRGEDLKCIRVEGGWLELENGTKCKFLYLYLKGVIFLAKKKLSGR